MAVRLICADVREGLRALEAESVNVCVCSPPYFSLRAYNTAPQVWGGTEGCDHSFSDVFTPNQNTGGGVTFKKETNRGSYSAEIYQNPRNESEQDAANWERWWQEQEAKGAKRPGGGPLPLKVEGPRGHTTGACSKCGAIRCELGLEPDVDSFVSNLVEVFAEVRRVLHPSGLLWVNLGSSFAGGGTRGGGEETVSAKQRSNAGTRARMGQAATTSDLPPGSLLGAPERFVLAMQREGWLWRQTVACLKASPMPESMTGPNWSRCRVKVESKRCRPKTDAPERNGEGRGSIERAEQTLWQDCPGCPKCAPTQGWVLRWGSGRPTSAFEFLYLFAKGPRNFFNTEGVRLPLSALSHYGGTYRKNGKDYKREATGEAQTLHAVGTTIAPNPAGANARNWLRVPPDPGDDERRYRAVLVEQLLAAGVPEETLESALEGAAEAMEGSGVPSVWWWRSEPLKAGHYAAFPVRLPLFCIDASTSPFLKGGGVCSVCRWPWVPVVERGETVYTRPLPEEPKYAFGYADEHRTKAGLVRRPSTPQSVLAYRPSCTCQAPRAPATVLDPFVGSGSTMLAADRRGCDGVGIDLSETYLEIARKRLAQDNALFGDTSLEADDEEAPEPQGALEF